MSVAGEVHEFDKGEMMAPGAKALFPLPGLSRVPTPGTEVDFTSINDYGGDVALKGELER